MALAREWDSTSPASATLHGDTSRGGPDARLLPESSFGVLVRLKVSPLMEDEPAKGRACLEGSADPQGSGDQDLRLPLVVVVA